MSDILSTLSSSADGLAGTARHHGPKDHPNLTPLDFFLFCNVKMKTKVFEIEKLKKRISDAVASVTPATLTNT